GRLERIQDSVPALRALMRTKSQVSSGDLEVYFSIMIGRPPRFALFPYTTLFRSYVLGCGVRHDNHEFLAALSATNITASCVSLKDRKSTRLNSSHLGISYAVFCLKKENNVVNHSEHGASTQSPDARLAITWPSGL